MQIVVVLITLTHNVLKKLGHQYKQTSHSRSPTFNKVSFGKKPVKSIRTNYDSSSQWDQIDPEAEHFYTEFTQNCKEGVSRNIEAPLSDSEVDIY